MTQGVGKTDEAEVLRRTRISNSLLGKPRPELRGHPSYALRRGAGNGKWKGGVRNHAGYTTVLMPEHPRAPKSGYVREHILVMERHLGRYLRPGENVHHKNGIRSDNRIENLELWVRPQNPGQRISDLVSWIVRDYRDLVLSELGQ